MKKQMTPEERKRKEQGRKAGVVGFAATAGLLLILFPKVPLLLGLGIAVSVGVGKVVSIMGEGLDLTTHNRKPGEMRQEPVREIPLSGNEAADSIITKGQEMLHAIRKANDAIDDLEISRKLVVLEDNCSNIFTVISENPDKASQVRKFMNYYLPTTMKVLNHYRTVTEHGLSAEEQKAAKAAALRALDMVLTAATKQLDNMYKAETLDVTTDIDVLEQMLKRDGYTENEIDSYSPEQVSAAPERESMTAAADEVMHGSPVLHVPEGQRNVRYVNIRKNEK